MRFLPTDEQNAFSEAVDEIVSGADGVTVAQQWANGDTVAGLALWRQFSELGLGGLRVAEEENGLGGSLADLVMVFERLGYHAVPGPYLETVALLPSLLDAPRREAIRGGAMATADVPGTVPAADCADLADLCFTITQNGIAPARATGRAESIAPTRRLSLLDATREAEPLDRDVLSRALDEAALACAAMLAGAGQRLLDEAVAYAKIREQFGQPIGQFQALKHQLADVKVALSFAAPLVRAAAIDDGDTRARSISAAKVAAGDAATKAAGVSLQVHGAIGYTAEHPLRLWIGLVPALVRAWGTPDFHRARIARTLLSA